MLELSWDEELAWEAQAHADTCRWGHDCSTCRKLQRWRSVGQNLYQSYRCSPVSLKFTFSYKLRNPLMT